MKSDDPKVKRIKLYDEEENMKDYSDNKICMEKTLFNLSVKGLKTATTRRGIRNYALGYGVIYTSLNRAMEQSEVYITPALFFPINLELSKLGDFREITIISITYKTVDNLTDEDARKEGFANRHVLYEVLMSFYPDLAPDSIVTIVEYRIRNI